MSMGLQKEITEPGILSIETSYGLLNISSRAMQN
jgi:hypothetical protein